MISPQCTPYCGGSPGRRYPQGGWAGQFNRPGPGLVEWGQGKGGGTGESVQITHSTPQLAGRWGDTVYSLRHRYILSYRLPSTAACPACWAMGTKGEKVYGEEKNIFYWAR
jgi:hypothetical protein